MKEKTKHYSNADITVVWKQELCAHAGVCWKGLKNVFNPKQRPWIRMEGAWTDEIITQVQQCPSGALSYFRNNETQTDILKALQKVRVEVQKNGPLLLHGDITIIHKDGSDATRQNITALCRCGASGNKPFCDGSHVRIDFMDE